MAVEEEFVGEERDKFAVRRAVFAENFAAEKVVDAVDFAARPADFDGVAD